VPYIGTSPFVLLWQAIICSVLRFASRIFRSEASPAVLPDGTTICVTDTDGNSVTVISASTGRVTGTIGAGELPRQIVITANGKTATVADPDSNAVSVIGHRHNPLSACPATPTPSASCRTRLGSARLCERDRDRSFARYSPEGRLISLTSDSGTRGPGLGRRVLRDLFSPRDGSAFATGSCPSALGDLA
jgi:YVTN family beta-propeller protein